MTLAAAVAEVLADCDDEELQRMIFDRTALVKARMSKLIDDVEAKVTAHQMLAAHLETCSATQQKISELLTRLQDDRLTTDQILELQTDLNKVRSELSQLESHSSEVRAVMSRASLVMKDRTMQVTVNLEASIQKMLDNIDNGNAELCAKGERLAEISEARRIYHETKMTVESDLQQLQESISAAEVEELSLAGIEEFMECLLGAKKFWSQSAASYERLNSVKQQLATLDPSSVDKTEDEFVQIETVRNALEGVLLDSIERAAVVIEKWQLFDETKYQVESVLTKTKSLLLTTTELGSLEALRERLAQTKVFCHICGFYEFY